MYVTPTGGSSNTSASGTNAINQEDFMKLLLAELKAQDPLSPMDTTTMTTQITLLNVLQELIEIKSLVQSLVPASSKDATGQSGDTSNSGGNGSGSEGENSGS